MTMMRRNAWAKGALAACLLVVQGFLVACSGSSEPTPTVATVEVTPSSADREVGETVQLSAAVKDANGNILSGQTVNWSSSASGVASVSASGLVTANALGTAIITAASGNKSGISTIEVVPEPIASISVAPTTDTLLLNETVQLVPTLRDALGAVVTGRTVSWSSNATSVATVSNSGLVTGIADGVATITATADGLSATAVITVFGPCSTALAPVIAVGATVDGALTTTDCRLVDGSYGDPYNITVTSATAVQIDLTSTAFDTWLVLFELLPDGVLQERALNDDVAPGTTDSQISFTLQPGANYFILVNSFDPGVFGPYQLKVATSGGFVGRVAGVMKPGKSLSAVRQSIKPPR